METGLPALFDGSASVGAESYSWDFGDGTVIAHPSTNATPSHTYVEPGSYTVRLEVARGDCGDEYCWSDGSRRPDGCWPRAPCRRPGST